jgi:hypothetical protein
VGNCQRTRTNRNKFGLPPYGRTLTKTLNLQGPETCLSSRTWNHINLLLNTFWAAIDIKKKIEEKVSEIGININWGLQLLEDMATGDYRYSTTASPRWMYFKRRVLISRRTNVMLWFTNPHERNPSSAEEIEVYHQIINWDSFH